MHNINYFVAQMIKMWKWMIFRNHLKGMLEAVGAEEFA